MASDIPLALASDAPEIGSAEAAVRSCVSLIAGISGQPERQVAYWCDLYYQCRCAYEGGRRDPAADPHYLTREDIWPVFRQLWQDAMKGAARREAQARAEAREAEATETGPSSGAAAPPSPEGEGRKTADYNRGNRNAANAAEEKRRIRDRLLALRARGVTTAQIVNEAAGKFSDGHVWNIVQGHVEKVEIYRALDKVLDRIEATLPTVGEAAG